MLKIEVIKFEAQDVITASNPNPNNPVEPEIPEYFECHCVAETGECDGSCFCVQISGDCGCYVLPQ